MSKVMERDSFSVSEFAARHGLTAYAVRKAVKAGKLPSGYLWEGGHLRIFTVEFMQSIKDQFNTKEQQ